MHSRFLLYADDLKIFRRIDSVIDADLLQSDLIRLDSWCSTNNLKLNLSKCYVIQFSKTKREFNYNYILNENILSKVDTIRDLGIMLCSDLSFVKHTLNVINCSSRFYCL